MAERAPSSAERVRPAAGERWRARAPASLPRLRPRVLSSLLGFTFASLEVRQRGPGLAERLFAPGDIESHRRRLFHGRDLFEFFEPLGEAPGVGVLRPLAEKPSRAATSSGRRWPPRALASAHEGGRKSRASPRRPKRAACRAHAGQCIGSNRSTLRDDSRRAFGGWQTILLSLTWLASKLADRRSQRALVRSGDAHRR